MELAFFDINPGVLGLIIWGLISYFTQQIKSNKNLNKDKNLLSDKKSFSLDYFRNILEPQEKIDFSNSNIDDISFQDLNREVNENEVKISKLEFNGTPPSHIHKIDKIKKYNNGLLQMLKNKKYLRSAFIMKEIIDKPVALKNNE